MLDITDSSQWTKEWVLRVCVFLYGVPNAKRLLKHKLGMKHSSDEQYKPNQFVIEGM